MLKIRRAHFILIQRLSSASSSSQDHYKTLGVSRDATQKEIKAAFYDLSKKYHPDTNPDDREKATEMFNKVAHAYEILGSADKKEIYDSMNKSPQRVRTPGSSNVYNQTSTRKQYTDLDIDYKDFEHFQKSNRRRRFYHDHIEMPDEFFEKFGGRTFKTRLDEQDVRPYNYADSRAAVREREERRILEEMEELRKKDRFPLPTFEQVLQEEAKIKATDKKGKRQVWLMTFGVLLGGFIYINAEMRKHRSASK
uniref:J domain-containing protein n=1 Tax=Acrobeloides nanus TaxID=290746 RepID=A0A914EMV8_9BILA